MTRRSWANEAQRAWLVAQTKFFIEARDSGTISDWRARAFQEWFDKFPEPEPTEQQIQAAKGSVKDAKDRNTTARKTQISNWFQNHNRGRSSGAGASKVLPLCKSTRTLQRWQAYLRLHGERVQPQLNAEWEKKLADGAASNQRLPFIATRAGELLAEESEEVRAEVEEFRMTKELAGEGTDVEKAKVNVQQQSIDNVPRTLQKCLDELVKLTGWVGSIIVGGPDPRSGSFKSFSYHVGKTVNAGSRFDQAAASWEKIESAFEEFLPKCYPGNTLNDLHQRFTAALTNEAASEGDGNDKGHGDDEELSPGNGGDSESQRGGEKETTDEETPEAPAAAADDDFEENRLRQIAANQQLLKDIGLEDSPIPKGTRPKPVPKQRVRHQAPVSSRELRSSKTNTPQGLQTVEPAREQEAGGQPATSVGKHLAPSSTDGAQAVTPLEAEAASAPSNSQTPQSVPLSSRAPTVPPTSTPSGTATPPQWCQEAYEHLRGVSDHVDWIVLTERWLTHERLLGYPDGSAPNRLPAKGRPEEIGCWIARARQYAKAPPMPDMTKFAKEWKGWWVGMQPAWRASETWPLVQKIPADGEVEWGVLHRGGCNAMFLVVLSLGWWWTKGEGRAEAESAIRDVAWVLSAMHNLLGNKRSHDDDLSVASKKSCA